MKNLGLGPKILLIALTIGLSACGDPEGGAGNGAGYGNGRPTTTTSDMDANTRPSVSGTDIDDAIAREWGSEGKAGDRVFFETDKTILKPEGRDQLNRWVAFLKKYPHQDLLVEGHSDERGTREYNLSLGERRGNTVKDFLVAYGIDATRIEVVTYGKERPDAVGSNPEAWALNRRAVGILK